jgi:hypothetical protein
VTAVVHLVLGVWVVLAIGLFSRRPTASTVVLLGVLGVLILPEVHLLPRVADAPAALSLPGFKLTKPNAISYGLLFGSLLADFRRWQAFRPRWFDLPVVAWCLAPLAASLANDLGAYDGVSQSLSQIATWGIPYLIGRLYLSSAAGLRLLLTGMALGGLFYVPLCLFEMRMSPQLHRIVYGFHQHEFLQALRLGGYRPMVFMQHGLALGMWMVTATLALAWLYWSKSLTRLTLLPGSAPVGAALPLAALGVTTVLCRSTGAMVLGAVGAAVLWLTPLLRTRLLVVALLLAPTVYVTARTVPLWTGEDLVAWVRDNLDEARAESLEFRLKNETVLVDKALERPVFGWGGWGRMRVYDDSGKDITVADGLWVIALGERGFFGVAALILTVLLPAGLFLWRVPPRQWAEPVWAPGAASAVLLGLYMTDGLLNAMLNPVFMLLAGGLAGLAGGVAQPPAAERRSGVVALRGPRKGVGSVLRRRHPPSPGVTK